MKSVSFETAKQLKEAGFPDPKEYISGTLNWYESPTGHLRCSQWEADMAMVFCSKVAHAPTVVELLPVGWVLKKITEDEWEVSPDDDIDSYPIMAGGVFPRPVYQDKNPHDAGAKAWLHLKRLLGFKPGDKVTFNPPGARKGEREKGIVKAVHPRAEAIWVVFNCGEDWDNYKNYTAALVRIQDLEAGWKITN